MRIFLDLPIPGQAGFCVLLIAELAQLRRLQAVAEVAGLARVSIKPVLQVFRYAPAPPIEEGDFVLYGAQEGLLAVSSEPDRRELRLRGVLLNIAADGTCHVQAYDLQAEAWRSSEAFTLDLAERFVEAGKPPREIFVTVERGTITGWTCSGGTPDLRITTIDHDVEGIERERLSVVDPGAEGERVAFVRAGQRVSWAERPVFANAELADHDHLFEAG